MYHRCNSSCGPQELLILLATALQLAPEHGPESFIIPFPRTPLALQGYLVRQLRLVGLRPGGQIPLHRDAAADCPGVRYHLPLQVNKYCLQFSENEHGVIHCQTLDLGRCYHMDPTQPHGAVNWGESVRLHLMIDVEER